MKAIQMPLWKGIFVIIGKKRKGSGAPEPFSSGADHALRDFRDVSCLRAFLTLNHFKLDPISFGKGFES
jgi:hypothetical protein